MKNLNKLKFDNSSNYELFARDKIGDEMNCFPVNPVITITYIKMY